MKSEGIYGLTPLLESKQGRTSLTKFVRKQIDKDVELIGTPGSGVKEVEWHLFPGKSGLGPTPELEAELKVRGIKVFKHEDFDRPLK